MRSRSLALSILVAICATPASAADYISTVTATDPLAYFRLTAPNEPSLAGGYTTSYTPTTGVGPGAPIAIDPANTGATFTGDNAAPSEVLTSLFGGIPGRGTINLWTNLAALPSTLGHTFALAGEAQGGNDFDFQIQTDNRLYIYTGAGENTSYTFADPSVLVGQWHMLTATFDGTLGAGSFRNLYVDGVEVASFTGGVNGATKTSQFTIGYNEVFGGRDFAGLIDEVTVWNYGLTADQVGAIYASAAMAGPTPGVPESSIWAMMIGGFGLAGASLRVRKRDIRFA